MKEVTELFRQLGVTIVPQGELGVESVEETGDTFVANALLKARHAAQETGLPAIADDSGLSVGALDGLPGVRSARYAGEGATDSQNVDKLLRALANVPEADRDAAFHCAAVYVDSSQSDVIAEGVWPGRIRLAREGQGGFGYDPVFFDPASGKTAANMSTEEKNAVSHRGKAFRQLVSKLENRRTET